MRRRLLNIASIVWLPICWLAICFVLAFLFAITWVVVMTYTLPPTNLAYGQRPFEGVADFPFMSMIASIAALFVYPFTYEALRDRPPLLASIVVAVIVLAELLVVTPFNAIAGFVWSFVAYGIGLLVARRVSRFSLRTLLILFTIASLVLGYLAWQVHSAATKAKIGSPQTYRQPLAG